VPIFKIWGRVLIPIHGTHQRRIPARPEPMDPRGLAWGHGALERRVPPGAPNFAPRLMAATWLLTVFSAIFLGLRLYCKLSRGRRLWWDDHFLTASWVGA